MGDTAFVVILGVLFTSSSKSSLPKNKNKNTKTQKCPKCSERDEETLKITI